MLDQRFAEHAHAFLACPADRLVRLLAGDVHDIERHAGHVGDHDGPICRLAFHFRRPRIGMALGTVVAGGEQFLRQGRDHVAILGMHQRQRAKVGAALERRIHLVVVHHQRAFVGHEVLERGDALVDDGRHLVEHLLAPPGDGHVEGIVAGSLGRLVVPHLQGLQQRLLRRRQAEIDHHRRAAGKGRARAGFEIIGRIGAHERHFEMGVRVDATRHDIASGGVVLMVAMQIRTDGNDLAVLDQHIRLPCSVGGDDGAVLDDFGHCLVPLFSSRFFASGVWNLDG